MILKIRIYILFVLGVFVLSACSDSGNNNDDSLFPNDSKSCEQTDLSLDKLTQKSIGQANEGYYQLEGFELRYENGDDYLQVDGVSQGQANQLVFKHCKSEAPLVAFENFDLFNQIPDELTFKKGQFNLNSKKINILNFNFKGSTLTGTLENVSDLSANSLDIIEDNLNSSIFQTYPVQGGFVHKITYTWHNRKIIQYRRYSFVEKLPDNNDPDDNTPTEPTFTKEQCIEKTNLQYDNISIDDFYFSKDCTKLFVSGSEIEVQLSGFNAFNLHEDAEVCKMVKLSSVRAKMIFLTSNDGIFEKLKSLNPNPQNFSIHQLTSSDSHLMSYFSEVGDDSLNIPTLNSFPQADGSTTVEINGALSGAISLASDTVCENVPTLKDNDSEEGKQKIIEFFIKHFSIKL